jgi:hypothetical protein
MIMIARYTVRPLGTRTWDAFAGRWASTTARSGAGGWCTWFHPRTETSSSAGGRACKGRPVREGKAYAALVSDSDLAVAWCQSGAVAGRARRQLAEIDQIVPHPGGAGVAVVSPDSRLRPPCPADGGDSLACVADGRCYGLQGVSPCEEESAR